MDTASLACEGPRPVSTSPIPFLRRIGKLEGVSFLLLLGVAMPLKYVAGMPLAVKVVGWIHGVLFVLFGVALLRTWIVARWPLGRVALCFVASLLPFGPFVIDGRLARCDEEDRRRRNGKQTLAKEVALPILRGS